MLLLLWVVLFIGAALAFEVMRKDRDESQDEKLAKIVIYPPFGLPRLRSGTQRRLGLLAALIAGITTGIRIVSMWVQPNTGGEIATLVIGVLALIAMCVMLTPNQDSPGGPP